MTGVFVFDSLVTFEPKHEDYEQQPYDVNQKGEAATCGLPSHGSPIGGSCVDQCSELGHPAIDQYEQDNAQQTRARGVWHVLLECFDAPLVPATKIHPHELRHFDQ